MSLSPTSEEILRRGEEARRILESPLFQEVFEALDARVMEQWRNGATIEVREKCHAYVVALEWVRDELISHINNETLERRKVDRLNGKTEPKR